MSQVTYAFCLTERAESPVVASGLDILNPVEDRCLRVPSVSPLCDHAHLTLNSRPEDRPAARFERPLSGGALESSPTSSASSPAHTPHPWQETEDSEALVPQGAKEPEGEGGPVCGDKAVEAAQDATLQSLSRGDGAGPLSLLRPSPFKVQGVSRGC